MAVSAIFIAMMAVVPALGAGAHFVGDPTFIDQGTTLLATGYIGGLGHENIDVVMDAHGTASVVCKNSGGNVAQGQDTAVDVSGSALNLNVDKNGKAFFSVTTNLPTVFQNTVNGQVACPNDGWTAIVTDVSFSSATINVYQPAGSGILVLTGTFSPLFP